MITFWIPDNGYADYKIWGKPALKTFVHMYFEQIGISSETKIIGVDKVDKFKNNIFLILDPYYLNSIIETGEYIKYQKEINWCVDNNITIAFDRSWECWKPTLDQKNLPFEFILITNITKQVNRVIDVQWFPKYLSTLNYKKYNLLPKNLEKNTLFSVLFGEIRKPHRLSLLAGLHKEKLIDNCFYTKFVRVPYTDFRYDYSTSKYYNFITKNWKELIKDKMFDMEELDETRLQFEDKKLPDQFYKSHFNIVAETLHDEIFYTEKTYKPIMAKVPFIIHGACRQNLHLKNYLGIEPYDEIFDYTFDNEVDLFKRTEILIKEIKRISKEPISIFSKTSVKEKINYNYYIYCKITNKEYIKHKLTEDLLNATNN